MTSSASTRERRIGICTSMPRRTSLYARSPPIFTAEVAGIGSSISPRRPASRRSSTARVGGSRRSTTAASGSPVAGAPVGSTSVTYRLSSPTKHEANLVADPDNKSNKPVAKGSRVPAWPVRAPVRRRRSETSANDDGPPGLSTRTIPAGLSARGGKELPAHEVRDLLDRRFAGETCGLPVPASVRLSGDRRHVELVDARSQADSPGRAVLARRLPDEHGHVCALDRTQKVDDSFRVGLGRADFGEVRAQEVGHDDASTFEDLFALESACEQLELCELH